MTYTKAVFVWLLGIVALAGCMMDDEDSTPQKVFDARVDGKWLLQFTVENPAGNIYVNDFQTYDAKAGKFNLEVGAYLDEARTVPILSYKADFSYKVVGESRELENTFELDIKNISAQITALIDEPELYAAIGLDDCNLTYNKAVDISKSGCAAPQFRDGSCLEKDIYQVAAGADEMFPAAGIESRCASRPTAIERSQIYKRQARDLP